MKSFKINALGLEELSMSEKLNTNGGQAQACLFRALKFLIDAYKKWREDTYGK